MKKLTARLLRLALTLGLVSVMTTAALAAEVSVEAVVTPEEVEVTMETPEDLGETSVWCAAYDKEGRMVGIVRADGENEKRLNCAAGEIVELKAFALEEDFSTDRDVVLAPHVHLWGEGVVGREPGYASYGEMRRSCLFCGKKSGFPMEPTAPEEEQKVIVKALEQGLLDHVTFPEAGELTRMEAAGLVMALGQYASGDGGSLPFSDAADLTAQEQDIIAALLEHEILEWADEGTLDPAAPCTNWELLKMAYRVMGEPDGDWRVRVMETCGIVEKDEIDDEARVGRVTALGWMLRSKEAIDVDKGLIPMAPVTNLRFETGGSWIYWDVEDGQACIERPWSEVQIHDSATGEWKTMYSSRYTHTLMNVVSYRWRHEGVYDGVRIHHEKYPHLDTEDRTMTITVHREELHDAVIELVDTAQGSALSITGLPPKATVRILSSHGDEVDDRTNDGRAVTVGDDGSLLYLLSQTEQEADRYFVESFAENIGDVIWSGDKKSIEYTVTCYGELDLDLGDILQRFLYDRRGNDDHRTEQI